MNEEIARGEVIIFASPGLETKIEVKMKGETVWLSQAQMAELFDKDIRTINEHIQNVYEESELEKNRTIRKFRIVRLEGAREVGRDVEHYNLDAIIAVGFRVNSARAIQFRQWATGVLRDYAIRGYVLDKERLKNGSFFNQAYFENLSTAMQDWAGKLNAFLQFNERDILDHPGKVSQAVAKAFAESEFEKYRVVQDRLFESDFDRHIKRALEGGKEQP